MKIKAFNYGVLLLTVLTTMTACGGDDNDGRDMTLPTISGNGIYANPADCQIYKRGDVIPFWYVFEDDKELGNYNIEIHNNFDHHSHGTASITCEMDPKKEPVKPWVYNKDFSLPAGQAKFTARHDIRIPKDIDPGDYHFMIRLTDKAGHQQIKGIGIKIKE